MDMNETETPKEPPYGAEYAKSGRSSCKGCKQLISQSELRMAVRFASKFFDGMQENWHHFECFWKKARKNEMNEAAIRGMEWLKWEDQERIRTRITEFKASDDSGYTPKSATLAIERAKSGTSKCYKCKNGIAKGDLRILSKASFYHVECFQSFGIFQKSAEDLVGYTDLTEDEQKRTNSFFPKATQTPVEESGGSKRKKEESTSGTLEGTPIAKRMKTEGINDDAKLKKQSEALWNTRTALRDNLSNIEMEELLEANGNYKSKKGGVERMLDKLVDCVVFGVPQPCLQCKGALNYNSTLHSYKCSGFLSEYTRCLNSIRTPQRRPFQIPKKMIKSNKFLKTIKTPLLSERIYSAAALTDEVVLEPKPPKNLNSVSKESKKKGGSSSARQKLVEKHGFVVDPQCDVADTCHVYLDPETKQPWQANLSVVDISRGKNSYYKLQIVKEDYGSNFYLFRSWGRIGTSIGGTKTNAYGTDREDCVGEFKRLFEEKSLNDWESYIAGEFKKKPGGMDILDVDFIEKKNDISTPTVDVENSVSNLPRPVKEILSMVFDVNLFTDTLREFEIDLTKMPLGRLSRAQVLKAYRVLTELQQILEKGQDGQVQPVSRGVFVDFTNRFYTLIPHATGLKSPPILDNINTLKEKCSMLDNLLAIEIAYNLLKSEEKDAGVKDAFDLRYEKLNCKMEVLDQNSQEFLLIKKLVDVGHAPTHGIQLEIINVLKIEREVESKRFKKDIGNLHLLWHGSRLSNYVGILSQGLRISPPEAPVTGYMFGKGIYFADMVTKSANYCYVMNGQGLLLLCEVALGDIQEEKNGREIKKPKRGKNSVKGIGGTVPNSDEFENLNGATIPCGKPIKLDAKDLSLLYNEFVVYDEAQIRLKYLVSVKIGSTLL
ncbi:Protein phosphatase methylesterase 1 [Globodera pallida]|nr:Protein phosphatase methylesterase 1 [Globodera pallida]